MPNERDETLEVLVIRGRLDRAGRFTPTRCRSTYNVREWPVVEASDHVVETVDPEDRTLHRELALVRPDIGLDPDAASVRLRRDDLVLWRTEIPPPAKVTVGLERSRPSRGKRYPLRVRFSEPGERAHLTVVYQWGPRQFRPIYIGPPRETVPIDLSELPGG